MDDVSVVLLDKGKIDGYNIELALQEKWTEVAEQFTMKFVSRRTAIHGGVLSSFHFIIQLLAAAIQTQNGSVHLKGRGTEEVLG